MSPDELLLPPHGNYRELLSWQKAEVAHDLTFRFCNQAGQRGTDRNVRDENGRRSHRTGAPTMHSFRVPTHLARSAEVGKVTRAFQSVILTGTGWKAVTIDAVSLG